MQDEISIDDLKRMISEDLNGGRGISSPPFSVDNILLVVDGSEEEVGDWNQEMENLDVSEFTDGEWSMGEPDDGDYGSIVLDDLDGFDMVKDDFGREGTSQGTDSGKNSDFFD